MEAAAAYVRTLRMRNFSSQAKAAKRATEILKETIPDAPDIDPSTVSRLENGKGKEGSNPYTLGAIITAIGGDVTEFFDLLFGKNYTANDGESRANQILQGFKSGGASEKVNTPEDVAELMRLFEEEIRAIRQEDRQGLGEAIQSFVAGFRAGRRRSGG